MLCQIVMFATPRQPKEPVSRDKEELSFLWICDCVDGVVRGTMWKWHKDDFFPEEIQKFGPLIPDLGFFFRLYRL